MLDLTEEIRTLGIYQPFATLMLHGKVETRFVQNLKKPPFPLGVYLIYSTIKCYGFSEAFDLMDEDQEAEARSLFRKEFGMGAVGTIHPFKRDFILGHAIGIGRLAEIIDPITPETKNTFVKYVAPCTRRRVGLVFEEMTRIKPFPIKGKQGVGFLAPEDRNKIQFV